jgi:predicted ATPase
VQGLPVLLVVTFRPDYQPSWIGLPHVTALALNRLGRRERTKLVEHITGGKSLPPDVLEQIVDRTDGVPLFVEELTKAVLESEQLYEARDRYVLERPIQQFAIPATLQDSLMARVDRLGSAREVLQIGAAIGRDFSHEVLAAVAGLPDAVLQDALARLAEAELVFMRGSPPNATYTFKHALVQDTAYSTMLRQRRQQLHTAIALVLEKRFPEIVKNTPEVIAQQFESAGRSQEAVTYWRKAGERYLRRFAMKESIAHYSNALRLVLAMPESRERDALELEVRLGLGLVQQIGYGPTAEDAEDHYNRALALCADRPDRGRERFLATWGLWFNATVRGAGMRAMELSDQLVVIAQELDNSSLLMEAYHAKIPMLLKLPDFAGMKDAAKAVIERYDRELHHDHAYYFGGHDARMCARSFLAWALWGEGLLDQASDMAWKSIEDARQLGHVFSIAHAMQRAGMTMMLLKDEAACRLIADELYTISERNNFTWQMLDALFVRGWLAGRAGDYGNAIGPMKKSASQPMFASFRPTYLVRVAEAELSAGDVEGTLATLQQASQSVETGVMHFCEPEIHRLRGEALIAQSRDNHLKAENAFGDALSLAARQHCRPLELRAAASMARLMATTGRREQGRDLLARIYAGFEEGFERPDLAAAKALLTELS